MLRQLIGTMGNTGASTDPGKANHVHYQLKDPSGMTIDPSAFWDQRGPIDPNPASPEYLGQHRQYLQDVRGLFSDASKNVRRPRAGDTADRGARC